MAHLPQGPEPAIGQAEPDDAGLLSHPHGIDLPVPRLADHGVEPQIAKLPPQLVAGLQGTQADDAPTGQQQRQKCSEHAGPVPQQHADGIAMSHAGCRERRVDERHGGAQLAPAECGVSELDGPRVGIQSPDRLDAAKERFGRLGCAIHARSSASRGLRFA